MGAFAKGLAAALNSYMDTKEDHRKQAAQKEELDWQKESRDFERENRIEQRRKAAEIRAEGEGVKQAMNSSPVESVQSVPVTPENQQQVAEDMSFGEYSKPDVIPPKQTYRVGGKEFASRDEATKVSRTAGLQAAADYHNNNGRFDKGLQLEDVITKKAEIARKLKQEGVFEAGKAALTGNPDRFMQAFNSTGDEVIVARPTVTERVITKPGFAPQTTFDYEFQTKDKDGNVYTRKINSHQLNESLLPYEKLVDLNMKAFENDSQAKQREAQLKIAQASLGISQAAANRAAKADDPLHAFNKAKLVFKTAYGRDPTQEEGIKLAGLAKDSYEKSDAEFASDIVKAGVTSGLTQPQEAPGMRQEIISKAKELRKPPAALPKGIPAGSKLIGTHEGKPVYQLPDGSKVKEQ
jgi:hypothetical protein